MYTLCCSLLNLDDHPDHITLEPGTAYASVVLHLLMVCLLQGHALRGEPIQSAPSNAVEVMCNTLSGYKLSQAQQLVRSLLKPNAEARPALADISLEFLLQ